MIEFFNHFINPASPHRAKVAVHLIAQGQAPSIVPAVSATTKNVIEKGAATATAVIDKGIKALGLNKTEKDAEDGEVVEVQKEANGTTPVLITDVREFKSRLQVSAGPQPVRHLSEFEELDAKL